MMCVSEVCWVVLLPFFLLFLISFIEEKEYLPMHDVIPAIGSVQAIQFKGLC